MAEHNAGMKVSNLYISQVKRKCGIEVGKNLRVATRRIVNKERCICYARYTRG